MSRQHMLIQFALTLTVLLAFCGLAIDVGMMELTKLKLQNAADAAALGAVPLLGSGAAYSAWQAAGKQDASTNGFSDGVNSVSVQITHPTTGIYANNPLAVQATVTQSFNPIFMPGGQTLSAQSTAVAPVSGCMYLLSQVYTTAPSLDATNQTVTNSCASYFGISYALTNASGGRFFVAGGSAASSGSVTPTPTFNVPVQPDPLAYLPAVATSSCTPANTNKSIGQGVTATLTPGTYCGTLKIGDQNSTSKAVVTFNSGVYIIAGSIAIYHATVTNTPGGVTFYMTRNGSYAAGTAVIQDSKVNLTAPTTGAGTGLEGILYYADRSLPPNQMELQLLYNDSSSTYDGVFYLPKQGMKITGQSFTGNRYTGIVADYLSLTNTGLSMTSNYSSLADGNPFHPTGGGLVQ